MQIVEYAKSHPWITGVVVVIGGLVFISISGVFSGGSSGSSGGGGSTKLSDAEIAANAAISAAQINAQATAAAAGASIQQAQIGAGVQMHSADLDSQVALRTLDVQRELGLSTNDVNKSLGLATIDAQKSVQINDSNNQVATQQVIASVGINAANQAASAQKSTSKNSMIGGIIGGVLGLFSDEKVKENIVRTGTSPEGYGLYEYNYRGDTVRRRGVIAQDVRKHKPKAVIENQQGLLMINPTMMLGSSI